MAIKSPITSKIHNKTKASFGISIQNTKYWVYPLSTVSFDFDVFSACNDKERANVEHLLMSGIIRCEVFMLRNGGYASCGLYEIEKVGAKKVVSKPVVEKVKEEKSQLLDGSMGIKVVDQEKDDAPFTGRVVKDTPKETVYDPFTKEAVVKAEEPAYDPMTQEPIKEDAPAAETTEEDVPAEEPKKTTRKRSKKTE